MKVESAAAAPDAPVASPRAPRGGSQSRALLLAMVVGGVLAIAAVLRFLTESDLWLDEALTVNIAKLPLSELTRALRHDGAPPLYFVLLHTWMRVFGTSDVAARALSGLLGLAMLPLAYLAGRRLGGTDPSRRRWVAWSAALVVAASPYAIRYSTEARMYVLAMVLVLLGYLAMWRAVERGTVGALVGVALVTAALLYTQYWSLFLIGVVGLVQLWRAFRTSGPPRENAARIVGAILLGGVLFLPWLSVFEFQMQHTGTPWDTPASPVTNTALGIVDFAGGRVAEGWTAALPLVLLAVLALTARTVDARRIEVDVRTVPGVRWEWLVGTATMALGMVLSAATGTGFQSRYAAVVYPLFALAVAYGVLAFGDARIRAAILALLVVVGFVGGVRNAVTSRTAATDVVAPIVARARAGDVVGYCPNQLGPAASRLIPAELRVRQLTFPDLRPPETVDWVDYASRNARASVGRYANGLLARAGRHAIWMVWSPGQRTLGRKCEEVLDALARSRPAVTDVPLVHDAGLEVLGLRRYGP